MKKLYTKPTTTVVDVKIEALMTCASCNLKSLEDNTGSYVKGKDITGSLGSGEEADAAGYRNNLWGD